MGEPIYCTNMMVGPGFGETFKCVPVHNNTSALHMAGNHTSTRVLSTSVLGLFYIREIVQERKVMIHYVPTEDKSHIWGRNCSASIAIGASSSRISRPDETSSAPKGRSDSITKIMWGSYINFIGYLSFVNFINAISFTISFSGFLGL